MKQLFTNHLGLRIFSFTNLQIWKKCRKKDTDHVKTIKKFKQFKKLVLLKKHNN